MPARPVERGLCGKMMGYSCCVPPVAKFIVRRHLRDQEWKLLGHIAAYKELFSEVGISVGIGEDDIDDIARAAQWRRLHIDAAQREIARKFVCGLGIDTGITHGQVVERPVLIRRARVVGHVQDPVVHFRRRRLKLRFRHSLWPRNGLDQRIAVERVHLVKDDDRDHKPVAKLRRSDGPPRADDDIEIHWARLRTDGLHQQIEVPRIAGLQNISFETLDRQHPSHVTGDVSVLGSGEHIVEGLLIGLTGGLGAPCCLSEFLFH
jgi:hypothetical protein